MLGIAIFDDDVGVLVAEHAARRYGVLALFAVAALALVWRAVDQQILEKDFLQSEGADRYLAEVDIPAHRGLITDRRGDVLALSTPVDTVAANPRLLSLSPEQTIALAKSLKIKPARLRERLEGGKFRALGEIGLDYHYDLGSPRVRQIVQWARQIIGT